jgi:hypothetical protein
VNIIGEVIPDHWLLQFKNEADWRIAVNSRGAWVTDAPDFYPEGTLLAASDEGNIGICMPNGKGSLFKEPSQRCNA